jgi:hypothetical protein
VFDLWDDTDLKCTFRRGADDRLMLRWQEIIQLASSIAFTDDEDSLIWTFNSKGTYSSQSLYKVINFRGIKSIFVPAVWRLKVPPRVHFFLWLLSKNKVLTRDNLSIRRKVDDPSCLFCCETETVNHLFFECAVAKQLWSYMSEVLSRNVGMDFLSIGQMWISNNSFLVDNMFCAAALWGLWKLRNEMCFQGTVWRSVQSLLISILVMLKNWILLCPMEKKQAFNTKLEKLRRLATSLPRLPG